MSDTPGPARILVAEDDPALRRLVDMLLSSQGYDVLTVNDGADALAAVDNWPPDALVVDVMMPRISGLTVCRELRADRRFATVPIILLTARVFDDDIQAVMELGGIEFMNKPFNPRQLMAVLERLVPEPLPAPPRLRRRTSRRLGSGPGTERPGPEPGRAGAWADGLRLVHGRARGHRGRRRRPARIGGAAAASMTGLDDLSTPGGLLLVAALLITGIAVTSAITDPDFWWHLRTGQLLIANHLQLLGTTSLHLHRRPPITGPCTSGSSRSASPPSTTSAAWRRSCPCSACSPGSGSSSSSCGPATTPGTGWPSGIGLIVAALAANPIWGPRDQMVDFTFSCLLLLMIERHLLRGGRVLWFVPPLFLLWSNLHGGFVVGLAFAALIVVGRAGRRPARAPRPGPGTRGSRTLAGVTVLSTLVSMINPNGPGILLYAAETLSSPAQQALILEWQSPDFHQLEVRGFAVMLVSLAGFLIANRRIRARDAVLVAATTALAFESVRNVAIFVAATTPTWIEQLSRILDRLRASAALAAALRRGRAAAQPPGGPGAPPPRRRPAGGDGAAPDAATSGSAGAGARQRSRSPAAALPRPGHGPGADHGGAAGRLGRGPPGAGDGHHPDRAQLRGELPGLRQRLAPLRTA